MKYYTRKAKNNASIFHMPSIKTDDYARLNNNGKDWILARDLCF